MIGRMMTKRISVLLMSIGLLAVLTACATGEAATNVPTSTSTIAPTFTAPAATEAVEPTDAATDEAEVSGTDEVGTTDEAGATDEASATEEVSAITVADAAATGDGQTPAEICAAAIPAAEPATREYTAPEQVLVEGVDYRAVFCTDAGPIYIDLLENYAPVTVNSFVFLAQNDYYNNTIFHRVIQNFMTQGGDPTGTGRGGPGYQFKDEFVGFLHFDRPGWLAMANANRAEQGIVGTNGSQFFITTVPTTHLDYLHTIFGEVLEGQAEVVNNIIIRDPAQSDSPATTLNTVVIITDPATVATTYTAPEKPEFATVLTALQEFQSQLPAEITMTVSEDLLTLDTAAATVPEDQQEAYSEFLTTHNYQSGVSSQIDNTACNLDAFAFVNFSYRLDDFASVEDATAALSDGYLNQLAEAEGFTRTESTLEGQPVYTRTGTACNLGSIEGRVYLRRGSMIATVNATIPDGRQYGVEAVLDQFAVRLYERTLSTVLRAELR